MEARRRGYRQQEAAPPERRPPLTILTRSHERIRLRSSAGAHAAPDPASLPGSGAHHHCHRPVGGARPRAGQRGSEHLVDGGDLQPCAVLADRHRGRRAHLGLRRRGGHLSRQSDHAAAADREREFAAVGGHGRRRSARAGGVLLRRRVRALHGGRTLAPRPRPLALRHLPPARGHAIERVDRLRRPVDLHLLERLVLEPLAGPRVGGALQLLEPDGARYLSLQTPDARQSAAIASYGTSPTTFSLLDVANRYVLDGAAFTPGVLAGLSQDQIAGDLSMPASPLTQAVVGAANEITAAICSVDGERPDAVCEFARRAGGGRGAQDRPPALSGGQGWVSWPAGRA